MLGGGLIPRMPNAPKPPKKPAKGPDEPLPGCTLRELAQAKGLPIEHLRGMGCYDTEYRYKLNGRRTTCKAVAMPYANPVQIRVAVNGKGSRFRWLNAGNPHNAKELYIVEPAQPTQDNTTKLFVEGFTDCAAASFMGLSVSVRGLPGTGTWTKHTGPKWAAQHKDDDVVVWQEPGEAGAKLVENMGAYLPQLRVIKGEHTGFKDLWLE
jgi:hypothetical protein